MERVRKGGGDGPWGEVGVMCGRGGGVGSPLQEALRAIELPSPRTAGRRLSGPGKRDHHRWSGAAHPPGCSTQCETGGRCDQGHCEHVCRARGQTAQSSIQEIKKCTRQFKEVTTSRGKESHRKNRTTTPQPSGWGEELAPPRHSFRHPTRPQMASSSRDAGTVACQKSIGGQRPHHPKKKAARARVEAVPVSSWILQSSHGDGRPSRLASVPRYHLRRAPATQTIADQIHAHPTNDRPTTRTVLPSLRIFLDTASMPTKKPPRHRYRMSRAAVVVAAKGAHKTT